MLLSNWSPPHLYIRKTRFFNLYNLYSCLSMSLGQKKRMSTWHKNAKRENSETEPPMYSQSGDIKLSSLNDILRRSPIHFSVSQFKQKHLDGNTNSNDSSFVFTVLRNERLLHFLYQKLILSPKTGRGHGASLIRSITVIYTTKHSANVYIIHLSTSAQLEEEVCVWCAWWALGKLSKPSSRPRHAVRTPECTDAPHTAWIKPQTL